MSHDFRNKHIRAKTRLTLERRLKKHIADVRAKRTVSIGD